VRSVTRVDERLLKGSKVQFVGSATSGIDHIDRPYLERADIVLAHAAGSNAPAVGEYVLTALFEMARQTGTDLFESTIGIVGVGRIGGLLNDRLSKLGIRTLLNDPPRAEAEAGSPDAPAFVSLEEITAESDILTLHVPYTKSGPHPTAGLIGMNELSRMREGAWLINTSRGGVVDEAPLIELLESDDMSAVIDVWTGEPNPNVDLVRGARIATPHIAGYTIESKARAVRTIADALFDWAEISPSASHAERQRSLPISPPPYDCTDTEFLAIVTRQAYDIARDHLRMQSMSSFVGKQQADFFTELRNSYRMRNEFASFTVASGGLDDRKTQLIRALGMRVE
jgi:erythronate-4-phosphate dehydrogenase